MGFLNGGVEELQIRNINLKADGYEPGDMVSGEVLLVANKDIKCRKFLILLTGCVQTYWQRIEYVDHGLNPGYETVVFIGYEKIIKAAIIFHKEGVIAPGNHVHKFTFRLPQGCPPSFAGAHGKITYELKAKIDRPWAVDSEVTTGLLVKGRLELNKLPPHIRTPVEAEGRAVVGACCCLDGQILITARTPKGAYAHEETVPIQLQVENATKSTSIMEIHAVILENARFTAFRDGGTSCAEFKTTIIPLGTAIAKVDIAPQNKHTLDISTIIPKVIPCSFRTSVIQTEHAIEIRMTLSNTDRPSVCVLPIVLGTLPLTVDVISQSSVSSCAVDC